MMGSLQYFNWCSSVHNVSHFPCLTLSMSLCLWFSQIRLLCIKHKFLITNSDWKFLSFLILLIYILHEIWGFCSYFLKTNFMVFSNSSGEWLSYQSRGREEHMGILIKSTVCFFFFSFFRLVFHLVLLSFENFSFVEC